ncbi:hypothetical protein DDB_G0270314 [Dictyostelium discoideum AX4]|uniref:LIM zinc-binding domain-containing protein n=1 Tax=Dictyostelium discoideum TaxID=44689 RepID=Q55BY3_DICDI|nr:hypothetical protein DDB_G0270314 [Dictyostelium discoideum AX4]EAL72507.1 hypothetical protein DDB_G0270314 [Dictyostelium discoideum AX4]|eukprot:XP_646698.1 hypothetical protein DDB_G0270314 [Dictyostelium discoideum AX4]
MPPKFGSSAPKCGVCAKSVYAAEASPCTVDGKTFHKSCTLCSDCRKGLDSTTICENESKLYCKSCYGRKFGPKLFGFGGGGAIAHTE